MKAEALYFAFASLMAFAHGANLRTSSHGRELGTYYPPEDSIVRFHAGGSPGARISGSEPAGPVINQNLCYTEGGDASTAVLKPDVTKVPHKTYGQGCKLNFHFPFAKSGDCSCTLKYLVKQEFGPTADWIAGDDMKLDCGNNVCVKIAGGMPGQWNMHEMKTNNIVFEPVDPTNPHETKTYDGDVEASWKIAGGGGKITITESTTFTNTYSKEQAESNKLKLTIGSIAFAGARMGVQYTNKVKNTITSTISNTATRSKTCSSVQCANGYIFQGMYKIYTKDKSDHIVVETCIFKCLKRTPAFAPGSDMKRL